MLNKNTRIVIKNRSNGKVGYTIPDMNNLRRTFQANEKKEVSFEELQKLSYIPGGMYLLKNYFILDNEEAIKVLIGGTELEYVYTEAEVTKLLLNGSLDELLDCLDFAPKGVVELVESLAVKMEISDLKKREAIQQKTGFNVSKAIEIKHEQETPDAEVAGARRVTQTKPENAAPAQTRRTVVKK